MARALDTTMILAGVLYPFAVYFGLRFLPPTAVTAGLVVLLAVRLAFNRHAPGRNTLPYLLSAAFVVIFAARSPLAGLKAYPVMVSLVFAAVFAYSLIWPPTIIEQIARFRHPDLPLDANSYLRKVTIVWLVFFLVNAAISTGTAISGSLRLWTLYNGFISYIAMGVIFAVEFLIRQVVRQQIRSTI